MKRPLLAAALVFGSSSAFAADIPPMPAKAPVVVEQPYDLMIELGAGVQVRPDYPGSKNYEAWPTGFVTLHYLQLPGYGVVKDGSAELRGWSFGPSFNLAVEAQDLGLSGIVWTE